MDLEIKLKGIDQCRFLLVTDNMESHQDNAIYPAQLAMDNPIITLGLQTEQEKPGSSCNKDEGVRKSVRCKRPPQSFSPGLESAVGERGEANKTKKQKTKSATAPDRLCDLMPNGDPFLCDLCMSPYVINRSLKRSLKNKRSKHNPAPRNKMDPLTGKILMLCNACSITFDRPRKPRKIIPTPTPEEMEKMLKSAKDFAKKLVVKTNRPEAERLYCPVVRPKACGCLQKYILGDGSSEEFDMRAKSMIDLLMKARELSAEKCYTKKAESPAKGRGSKNQGVGIGNGQKRSKAFEDFVLNERTHLKTELKLCERAVQKVLMYSNNFLHKKLVTEKSLCRAKPVNGMARKGLLQPFDTISQTRCCVDNCVMMAITHKKLLEDWRERANKGQSEHRRVIAEMLTPSAGARTNCYTFITFVTGASRSTIVQVSHQMKQTGGEREPPTHGMKKFWQSNNRRKSTHVVSPTKVTTHLGKTSTSTTFSPSVYAPASKPSVITTSCNPTPTTSNILIPVSVSTTSSGPSSLTMQRQQLMQIQQQMFEQQVQQQKQQHLLQQQLLQHTIMQQIGQAADGMPQNLPKLQTMIDQLNVQIQNTQQQLQLSLRTMNMIGSQPVASGGSSQSHLSTAEYSSNVDSTSHSSFLTVTCNNMEGAPVPHSNLLHMCGTSESASVPPFQQQSNGISSNNVNTNLQTTDQRLFAQNTNQILSNLSPQDHLQFFNQLSPSQMQSQTHGSINNSQNYFNNLSMANSGHTIIQVQQTPAQPTQYVQTFLQGSQLHKGRANNSNETGLSEQFVIQSYSSMNQSVQENTTKTSQNSVLIQQLNAPVNQGQRITVPPLVLVNQQQVDCGDGLPSASPLSKELYDISDSGFQQPSNRIDTEHGLLNTPILDLAPAVIMPYVSISGQTATESSVQSTHVASQTSGRNILVTGHAVTGNSLGPTVMTSRATSKCTLVSMSGIEQSFTENTMEQVSVTGQTIRAKSTSITDQTTSENNMMDHTNNGGTSESIILTEVASESAGVIDATTPGTPTMTVVSPISAAVTLGHIPVKSSSQSVISGGLISSVLTKRDLVPGIPSYSQTGYPCLTSTSNVSNPDSSYQNLSHTMSNTKTTVPLFHSSPKSAFYTPQKLAVVTCNSTPPCTPTTSQIKCGPDGNNSEIQMVKSTSSPAGNSHHNITRDLVHDTGLSNVTLPSLSSKCKSKSKSTRHSQMTKVTQSRFPTTFVTNAPVVPSTHSDTTTYISIPMIRGVQRPDLNLTTQSKSESAIKQVEMVPVNQPVQRSALFLQRVETESQLSLPEIQRPVQQSENIEKVGHVSTKVQTTAEKGKHKNSVADVTHTSTDTLRPSQAMLAPLSHSSIGIQAVTSASHIGQGIQAVTSASHIGQGIQAVTSASHIGQGIQAVTSASHIGQCIQAVTSTSHIGQGIQAVTSTSHVGQCMQAVTSASHIGQGIQAVTSTSHVGQGIQAVTSTSHIGQGIQAVTSTSHVGQGIQAVTSTSHVGQGIQAVTSTSHIGQGIQAVTSTSQVGQGSVHYNAHAPSQSHSVGSHKKVSVTYSQNTVTKNSTKGLVRSNTELKTLSLQPPTPVTKTVSDSSQMLLNVSTLQLQNMSSSLHQSGNDKQHSTNTTIRSVSSSTSHKGLNETPLNDSIHPINCTLVINHAQNQRAALGPGSGQPIIGQIQPMLLNPANQSVNVSVSTTHPVVSSKSIGDQRAQRVKPLVSNTQLVSNTPLVPSTTITIDSDTLMRLCQQASLPRTPIINVNVNTH